MINFHKSNIFQESAEKTFRNTSRIRLEGFVGNEPHLRPRIEYSVGGQDHMDLGYEWNILIQSPTGKPAFIMQSNRNTMRTFSLIN